MPLHLEVILNNKPSKAKTTIFFTSAHSECLNCFYAFLSNNFI